MNCSFKTMINVFRKYLCIGIDLMGLLAAISLFVVLGQNILRFQAQCNLFSPTQRTTLNGNRSKIDSSQVQDGLSKICLQMPIPESVKCHYHANLVSTSFWELKYKMTIRLLLYWKSCFSTCITIITFVQYYLQSSKGFQMLQFLRIDNPDFIHI